MFAVVVARDEGLTPRTLRASWAAPIIWSRLGAGSLGDQDSVTCSYGFFNFRPRVEMPAPALRASASLTVP